MTDKNIDSIIDLLESIKIRNKKETNYEETFNGNILVFRDGLRKLPTRQRNQKLKGM